MKNGILHLRCVFVMLRYILAIMIGEFLRNLMFG